MSPLKLQKMLYFLNGWHLAVTGTPAIKEPFEAWDYGPVVPEVYREFRQFGKGAISKYAREFDPASGEFMSYVVRKDEKEFYDILDAVWENYIGYPALTLSAMTHQDSSPWDIAYKGGGGEISSGEIKKYFVSKVHSKDGANDYAN